MEEADPGLFICDDWAGSVLIAREEWTLSAKNWCRVMAGREMM